MCYVSRLQCKLFVFELQSNNFCGIYANLSRIFCGLFAFFNRKMHFYAYLWLMASGLGQNV